MKKGIFLLAFSLSCLLANIPNANNNVNDDTQENKEAGNIIKSASKGREVIIESKLEEEEKPKEEEPFVDRQLFEKELILNWNIAFKAQNPRSQEVVAKYTPDSLVKNIKFDPNANGDGDSKNAIKKAVVKGFCFIPEEINVGKQKASLRAECQTNHGAITIFGNLVNADEVASLVLDPKYIEKNGYRYQVITSIVTNEDKTSYNLATYVNDRKVKEAALASVAQGAQEVKTYTNQYLNALESSRTSQNVVYQTVTSGSYTYTIPTTVTNTSPPDPLYYLAVAGTNIITSGIKSLANSFKKDLPYLYQIVAKTKIWIDLEVNEQGEYVKWKI